MTKLKSQLLLMPQKKITDTGAPLAEGSRMGSLIQAIVPVAIMTLILCLGFLVGCNSSREADNTNKTPVISGPPNTTFPMPPLKGKSLAKMGWATADGKHSEFSEYKGKVLVLDFYATWCMPCRDSVPHLVELQRRLESQGLQIVGLNVGGPDDLDQVPRFAREFNIQYPLGVPDEDLISFLLSDNSDIPQTFVFDRKGQLTQRFIGFGDTTGKKIDDAINLALKSAAD